MIFTVPGRISVPPAFVGDVAVFYIKDMANVGRLHFYKFAGETISELHVVQVDTSVNTEFHKYSLVKVDGGVIFKTHGGL